MTTLRVGCMAAVLLIPAFRSGGANLPSQAEGHRSGMMATVVSTDGTSRTVKLEGVGCSESMCSRVFIRSKGASGAPLQTWFDTIASIKDATATDALFVMKDGTERRLTLAPDFRVFYVSSRNGGAERLDLAKIRSLAFVDSGK
jgi:hypothetical protein